MNSAKYADGACFFALDAPPVTGVPPQPTSGEYMEMVLAMNAAIL